MEIITREQNEKTLKALLEAVRKARTSIMPYWKMGNFSEKDVYAIKSTTGPYQGEALLVYESYCVSPQCDCRSVHLDLVPHSNETARKPAYFRFDFETGGIGGCDGGDVPEQFRELAEEFSRDARKTMQPLFRKHYSEAKKFGAKLQQLLIACDDFKNGALVCYHDVYPEDKNWCFSHRDQSFTVIDQYCPQPDCHCRDTVFTFYNSAVTNDASQSLFAVRLKEDGQFTEEERSVDRQEMEQIIKAFTLIMPDFKKEMLSRLQKVKEFGRMMIKERISKRQIQSLLEHLSVKLKYYEPQQQPEPALRKTKVGRNEPCPCGSGKKYKRCCGR